MQLEEDALQTRASNEKTCFGLFVIPSKSKYIGNDLVENFILKFFLINKCSSCK